MEMMTFFASDVIMIPFHLWRQAHCFVPLQKISGPYAFGIITSFLPMLREEVDLGGNKLAQVTDQQELNLR